MSAHSAAGFGFNCKYCKHVFETIPQWHGLWNDSKFKMIELVGSTWIVIQNVGNYCVHSKFMFVLLDVNPAGMFGNKPHCILHIIWYGIVECSRLYFLVQYRS